MDASKLEIRPIQVGDNATLASIIREVFVEYDAPQEGTVYVDPTTDRLYELFQAENARCYTAIYENEIVGCCGIYPTEGLPTGYVELVKFYISRKGRGIGIGRQLMMRCESEAKTLGYSHIYLESLGAFSKAVGIYEKTGYEYLPNRLGNTGHSGCKIWMCKNLEK